MLKYPHLKFARNTSQLQPNRSVTCGYFVLSCLYHMLKRNINFYDCIYKHGLDNKIINVELIKEFTK